MARKKDDTIASRISRVLAERIIRGELAPDSRLRQDHLAEEFGASHVPVREAFRLLEAQGLAISEPRRGFRVASFDLKEVREVAEMRAALESLALKHAAPHLTSSILDAAEEAARQGDAASDVHSWEEGNRSFHADPHIAPCRACWRRSTTCMQPAPVSVLPGSPAEKQPITTTALFFSPPRIEPTGRCHSARRPVDRQSARPQPSGADHELCIVG